MLRIFKNCIHCCSSRIFFSSSIGKVYRLSQKRQVDLFSVVDHFRKILFGKAHKRPPRAFARAIAAIGDLVFVKQIERDLVAQKLADDFLVRKPAVKISRHRINGGHAALEQVDKIVVRTGEKLNHKTARRTAGVIGVDQDAQPADGGDLFAHGKITGDVLGNLARYDRGYADIRLFFADIAHKAHNAVSHGARNVELPFGFGRKISVRIFNVALHVARIIGHGDDLSADAVARKGERRAVGLVFQ